MESSETFNELVRKEVIPELINQRLKLYNLDEQNIKLYSERKLRNIVRKRTRTPHKQSEKEKTWKQLKNFSDSENIKIGSQIIVNEKGNPLCRGIILALIEKVVMEGYEKIHQIYPEKHHLSLTKAQMVFEQIKGQLPHTKNKKLEFEYRWR